MIVAMLTVYVTIALAPFALYDWVTPTLNFVLWMGVVAFFASAGHYFMTKALQLAPIAVSQPVTFLQLIWATLIGYYFFGEGIDIFSPVEIKSPLSSILKLCISSVFSLATKQYFPE